MNYTPLGEVYIRYAVRLGWNISMECKGSTRVYSGSYEGSGTPTVQEDEVLSFFNHRHSVGNTLEEFIISLFPEIDFIEEDSIESEGETFLQKMMAEGWDLYINWQLENGQIYVDGSATDQRKSASETRYGRSSTLLELMEQMFIHYDPNSLYVREQKVKTENLKKLILGESP